MATLEALGLPLPVSDAARMERYLRCYSDLGLIPVSGSMQARPGEQAVVDAEVMRMLTKLKGGPSTDAEPGWAMAPGHFGQGILHTLTAARFGQHFELRRYRATSDAEAPRSVVVKVKQRDDRMIGLSAAIASLCDERLGHCVQVWGKETGLSGAQLREQALYAWAGHMSKGWLPRLLGDVHIPSVDACAFVMEDVASVSPENVCDTLRPWSDVAISSVLKGLVDWQVASHERLREEGQAPDWLDSTVKADCTKARRALWHELGRFAESSYLGLSGRLLQSQHQSAMDEVDQWWSVLQRGPQTIVHNDFNPRNLLRRRDATAGYCALDWELAKIGLPQEDFAQFLCFVLEPDRVPRDFRVWIQRHFALFRAYSGIELKWLDWCEGYAAALDMLVVERWPMYLLMHHFRAQPYLARVLKNCAAMRRLLGEMVTQIKVDMGQRASALEDVALAA